MTGAEHSHEDLAADLRALADDLDIPSSTAADAIRRGSRQRVVTGVAAAAGLVVVLVLVALVATGLLGEADTAPVVRQPVPSAPPTETTAAPTMSPDQRAAPSPANGATVEAALAVADEWFAAYGDGNLDAMVALLAPDAQPDGDRTTWMQTQAFKHAEGAVPVDVACEGDPDPDQSDAVRIVCTFGDHEYSARVVDAPPVPNTQNFIIDEAGIHSARRIIGSPDYLSVAAPFEAWLAAYHPEVIDLSCCDFDSMDHAQEVGRLAREWAEAWAAFLERTGCASTSLVCQLDPSAESPAPTATPSS